jgi:hypothetical protein
MREWCDAMKSRWDPQPWVRHTTHLVAQLLVHGRHQLPQRAAELRQRLELARRQLRPQRQQVAGALADGGLRSRVFTRDGKSLGRRVLTGCGMFVTLAAVATGSLPSRAASRKKVASVSTKDEHSAT